MKRTYLLISILITIASYAFAQKPIADFSLSDTILCMNNCGNLTDLSTNNPTSWKWSFAGGFLSSTSVRNPFGCSIREGIDTVKLVVANLYGSDSISKTILVHPAPPVPAIMQSHDTLFCSTDTSYVSYQWYAGNALVVGATNSFWVPDTCPDYNVLVKNRYGCSIAVGINIILQWPSFTCHGDTICVDSFWRSFQWLYNGDSIPGATNACIIATAPDTYSVSVQLIGKCYFTVASTCNPLGINKFSDSEKIIFYPNPLTSSSILQLNEQARNAEVIISDMLGKVIARRKMNGNRMEIEKGNLERGVYLVRVRNGERQYLQKIVVE